MPANEPGLYRVPSRGASAQAIDQWNQLWRSSQTYADVYRMVGGTPGKPLSDDQRRNMLAILRSYYGIQIPQGMNIDPAGNLNQKNLKAENVLKGAAIGAAGAGVAGAAGAFGGPAGSAGGTAAAGIDTSIGGAAGMAPSAVPVGLSGEGALAAGAAGTAAAGAGRRGGVLNTLAAAGKGLLSPESLTSLAPLIAALASRGGPGGGTGPDMDFLRGAYADSQRNQAMQTARYRRVDPLHEAVTQLAFNRLPISARQGVNLTRVPLPD